MPKCTEFEWTAYSMDAKKYIRYEFQLNMNYKFEMVHLDNFLPMFFWFLRGHFFLVPYGQVSQPSFSGAFNKHELQGISWSSGYSETFELRLKDLGGIQPPPK